MPGSKEGRSGKRENADGGGDGHRRRAHFGGRVRTRAGKEGHFLYFVCLPLRVRGCLCVDRKSPAGVKLRIFLPLQEAPCVFMSLLVVPKQRDISLSCTTHCRLCRLLVFH